MRDNQGFSLTLVKPASKERWPELTGPDGRVYICGVPRKEFEVNSLSMSSEVLEVWHRLLL